METLWDRLDPGFLRPIWLGVGLLTIVAVALLYAGSARARRQAVRTFAALHLASALTSSVSPARRYIKALLMGTAVALLFIALARPHLFNDWTEENRSGLDILLAVDCSKSMQTEDVKPNRLERAKLAIADFADRLPENRLGLIAFAGDAFLQCPLTLDHDAFLDAVRDLSTNTIPRPGTDIASAIDEAADALRSQPNNLKFVVLITDGEDLEGRAIEAAKNAAVAGLKIYTVGVGTASGGTIPERDGAGGIDVHRDTSGREVESHLDETTLRQIAELTGGAYVPLGQRGEGLDEIYNHYIAALPRQNLEEKHQKLPIERFEWPLGLAIFLLMCEFLIRERATPRKLPKMPPLPSTPRRPRRSNVRKAAVSPPLAALLLLPVLAHGVDTATPEREYKSGQYDQAAEGYQKAAEQAPTQRELRYNSGDAAYKAGDYTGAEDAYRKALETPDLALQEQAYYNLGNAQFRHGLSMQKTDSKKTIKLWEQALHSYDSALKLKDSKDAAHNYEYVKKMLEEMKQKRQQQKDGPGDGSDSQSDNPDSGGQQQDQSKGGDSGAQQQNQSGQQEGQQGQQQKDQQGQPPPGKDNDQKSGKDKQGNQQAAGQKDAQLKTYSGTRPQDTKDPGIKSRQDAENLLDSLKDDEHRVSTRALNGENQTPSPPSGKDW